MLASLLSRWQEIRQTPTMRLQKAGAAESLTIAYVPPKLLVSEADGFVFKPGVAKATDPIGDKILKCHFIHWKKAARLGDQMTLAGGFRLLADLADLKVAIILFTEYYE